MRLNSCKDCLLWASIVLLLERWMGEMLVNSCLSVHLTHSGHPSSHPIPHCQQSVSPAKAPGELGASAAYTLAGCRARAARWRRATKGQVKEESLRIRSKASSVGGGLHKGRNGEQSWVKMSSLGWTLWIRQMYKSCSYVVLQVALGLCGKKHQCIFHHPPHPTTQQDSAVHLRNIFWAPIMCQAWVKYGGDERTSWRD